jgi:hypothetical protein
MDAPTRAGFWDFVFSFRKRWFAAMSGGASVPFTALAVFLDNKWAQVLFAFCALTGAGFASYRLWRPERERVIELEEQLRPKLAVSFHPEAEGLVQTPVMVPQQAPGSHTGRASYIRIRVEASSETTVTACSAFWVGLEKKSVSDAAFVQISLPHSIKLIEPFDAPPGVRRTVDFLIALEGQNKLTPNGDGWPLSLSDAFDDIETTYRCVLAVNGNGITSRIKVDVFWRGQWDQITASEAKD